MRLRDAVLSVVSLLVMVTAISFELEERKISKVQAESEVLDAKLVPERVSIPVTDIRVPIIIYHHIRPETKNRTPEKRQYEITTEEFEAQISYLKDGGYTSISFADLQKGFEGKVMPEKPVIITFDDGRDNQYEAWKKLTSYGFHGTWFVFTNAIGRPNYLTWEQLDEMYKAGEEVESHTVYHPYLTKQADEDLKMEMVKSRDAIQAHLGFVPTVVAYPFGLVDDRVVKEADAAGYVMARGLEHKNVQKTEERMNLGGWVVTGDIARFKTILEHDSK